MAFNTEIFPIASSERHFSNIPKPIISNILNIPKSGDTELFALPKTHKPMFLLHLRSNAGLSSQYGQ